MTTPAGIYVQAAVQVLRGTATHCACGGPLEQDGPVWRCRDCGRVYT